MTMPNFLIIGAGKAGTTSIYHYLKQHPEIYMSPIKEANFFAQEALQSELDPPEMLRNGYWPITNLEAYQALYQGGSTETAIGEASPRYLYWPGTAECIRRYIPDVKLIAILRDPVERAYSSYQMHVRDSREKRTFAQVIRDEEWGTFDPDLRIGQKCYVRFGFYYRHLLPYFKLFGRHQIKVYLFEDLKADPSGLLQDIFRFLAVSDDFVPDMSIRYNMSGHPKNKMLQPLLGKSPITKAIRHILPAPLRQPAMAIQEMWRGRQFVKPSLSPEIRSTLIAGYRDDILQLQDLIQRDLSNWLL
jgi:hypothetical protein